MKKIKNIYLKHYLMSMEVQERSLDGGLEGIKISFSPVDEDEVFNTSEGKIVNYFPEDASLFLSIRDAGIFNSLILESISSYLYNIRSKIASEDIHMTLNSLEDGRKYKIRLSHLFKRQDSKGRYKISVAIIEDDVEIINLNFTKRDLKIISNVLKRVFTNYRKSRATPVSAFVYNDDGEEVAETTIAFSRVDNSVVFGNIWLHGQEVTSLMYMTGKLIEHGGIERSLSHLHTTYRQIMITHEGEVAYLVLKKIDPANNKTIGTDYGEGTYYKIPVSSTLLSALYLSLDMDVLRFAKFLDEYDPARNPFENRNVKAFISLKESIIGLSVKENRKGIIKMKLLLKIRPDAFSVENEQGINLQGHVKVYDENNNEYIVKALDDIDLDLQNQWPKFIKGLSQAYSKEFLEHREINSYKFYVTKKEGATIYKYEFKMLSDPENKAAGVLIIDKKEYRSGKHIGRYRQPLFEKYIYQIIAMFLATVKDVENIDYVEEVTSKKLLKYVYSSMKKVKEVKRGKDVKYGIKKRESDSFIGDFTTNNFSKLSYADQTMVNISSENRLYTGRWLPFTGEKITIDGDGYITDPYAELFLEENEKGSIWATRLFAGTAE